MNVSFNSMRSILKGANDKSEVTFSERGKVSSRGTALKRFFGYIFGRSKKPSAREQTNNSRAIANIKFLVLKELANAGYGFPPETLKRALSELDELAREGKALTVRKFKSLALDVDRALLPSALVPTTTVHPGSKRALTDELTEALKKQLECDKAVATKNQEFDLRAPDPSIDLYKKMFAYLKQAPDEEREQFIKISLQEQGEKDLAGLSDLRLKAQNFSMFPNAAEGQTITAGLPNTGTDCYVNSFLQQLKANGPEILEALNKPRQNPPEGFHDVSNGRHFSHPVGSLHASEDNSKSFHTARSTKHSLVNDPQDHDAPYYDAKDHDGVVQADTNAEANLSKPNELAKALSKQAEDARIYLRDRCYKVLEKFFNSKEGISASDALELREKVISGLKANDEFSFYGGAAYRQCDITELAIKFMDIAGYKPLNPKSTADKTLAGEQRSESSSNDESTAVLSVPIKDQKTKRNVKTMQEAVEKYFAPEKLEVNEAKALDFRDDLFGDDGKPKKCDAVTKQLRLESLPTKPFNVTLNRFDINLNTKNSEKNQAEVTGVFDEIILRDKDGREGRFSPISFSCHRGENVASGHYVNYRKEDGVWYQYNDSIKARVNLTVSDDEFVKKQYMVTYAPSC